jgi:biopolymer transport protein ExbD
VVVINPDAKTAHQNVIDVMQAARNAGLTHISFATQQKQQ